MLYHHQTFLYCQTFHCWWDTSWSQYSLFFQLCPCRCLSISENVHYTSAQKYHFRKPCVPQELVVIWTPLTSSLQSLEVGLSSTTAIYNISNPQIYISRLSVSITGCVSTTASSFYSLSMHLKMQFYPWQLQFEAAHFHLIEFAMLIASLSDF